MSKQVLDRLQMRHLKELGLGTSKASAYWHRVVRMNTNEMPTMLTFRLMEALNKTIVEYYNKGNNAEKEL
jgi:hypothetical protein